MRGTNRRHALTVVEQQYMPEKKRFANPTFTLSIGYFIRNIDIAGRGWKIKEKRTAQPSLLEAHLMEWVARSCLSQITELFFITTLSCHLKPMSLQYIQYKPALDRPGLARVADVLPGQEGTSGGL